jgi:hypothetical protein
MRRLFLLVVVALVMGVMATPVAADVDQNPGASRLINATCLDGSLTDAEIWGGGGVAGHDLADGVLGTAKSVYVFPSEAHAMAGPGHAWFVIYDVPGIGLDKNTIWCWYQRADTLSVWFGSHIKFQGNAR